MTLHRLERGEPSGTLGADLWRAVEDLGARPHRLNRCMQALALAGPSTAAP